MAHPKALSPAFETARRLHKRHGKKNLIKTTMRNATINNSTRIHSPQSAVAPANRGRQIGYGIAALLLARCGFFVAAMPVRPGLAGVSVIFVVVFALPSFLSAIRWLGARLGVLLLMIIGKYFFSAQ